MATGGRAMYRHNRSLELLMRCTRTSSSGRSGALTRNESLAHLTFPNGSFDHIITFDVLEHFPDVEKALR